jgi:MSHA biogenesis protein MshI
MSLLKKINKLFSKQQMTQVIGIALQQQVISLCAVPQLKANALSKKDDNTRSKANLSTEAVIIDATTHDEKDFSKAIKSLDNKHNLSGQAFLVLNATQTQIVQVNKPSVPDKDICAALKWQIKDLVSISPDNMVLDYFDGPVLSGGAEKINVVCAAASELKSLVAVINSGGMELQSITTEEFAFANLIGNKADACLLVCQQPNEEILLLIVKQGQLYFHRRLRGFSNIASKTNDELVNSVVDDLSLEIQRSTDYFERQLKQAPIKELKVLLPIPAEALVARKLAENTNVPVTLLALPEPYHEQRDFAVALGAVILNIETESTLTVLSSASEADDNYIPSQGIR